MRRGRRKPTTSRSKLKWLRGRDLNPRPLGYEPNELPDCSTPRHLKNPHLNTTTTHEPLQHNHATPMTWLLVVVPGLIWGASFLFIAEGLQAVDPMGVPFVRIAIGFATLSLVPSARRPILRSDRVKTAVLGVIWLAFPLSMFPFAEQHVSSALAGMMNGATPLFAAVVASLLERRAPSRQIVIGLAIGFGGAVLI